MLTSVIDKEITLVLKAFAVLGVIFAHVGYVIFSDHSFLFPLSVFGGVAGDLFFFLSGLGLACTYPKWIGKTKDFYIYRIKRIFWPIFGVLLLFFVADIIIHSTYYSPIYAIRSFLMIFPTHDVAKDINSPLWFMTPILLYYIFFPLLYRSNRPVLSAFGFMGLGFFVSRIFDGIIVSELFKLHYIAFPLGILAHHFSSFILPHITPSTYRNKKIYAFFLLLFVIFLGIHSGVGKWYEQGMSLFIMGLFILAIITLDLRHKILINFGAASFGIYLIHWPLMSRFDPFVKLLGQGASGQITWLILWLVVLYGASRVLMSVLRLYDTRNFKPCN